MGQSLHPKGQAMAQGPCRDAVLGDVRNCRMKNHPTAAPRQVGMLIGSLGDKWVLSLGANDCHRPVSTPERTALLLPGALVLHSKKRVSLSPALPEQEWVLQEGERRLTFGSHRARLSL